MPLPPELPALLSALFFGLSIPLSKTLLGSVHPLALSALLYLGSGLALTAFPLLAGEHASRGEAPLAGRDYLWLLGAILCGGVLAPVCFLTGLRGTAGSVASLLLNLEAPFTVLAASLLFKEAVGARAWTAMACMLAGSLWLSYDPSLSAAARPADGLLLVAACGLWALDNNLTRAVAHKDPMAASRIKGLAAGATALLLAALTGSAPPPWPAALAALGIGAVCYGASLVLFIRSLRGVGAGRTGIIFASAPFIGTLACVLSLGERLSPSLVGGGALMAAGAWLLVREKHGHAHRHERLEHDHRHVHDEHHGHEHPAGQAGEHAHAHTHPELEHSHGHRPDIHHRHPH
ncbi:MAG: EamA family transporter [Elusimicrobia bacterium]|nr:EamA family transporter [Elusimicrobiota bacterium]